MKRTLSRSVISLVLAAVFLLGLGVLCFRYVTQGYSWANQPYNQHQGATSAGKIYDRNGVVLAQTVDGVRCYHEDVNVRTSIMHCITDDFDDILTAVKNRFRSKHYGYNGFMGYSMPELMGAARDITLTLDAEVCGKVYEAFGGKNGACVVYNYKTGEVLCMVSTPSFDPRNVPAEIPNGSYYNNAVSSTYTPGSIYKIITTIGLIESGQNVDELTFICEGERDFGGDSITCMDGAHGEMGIYGAFSHSCNIAFAEAAVNLGAEYMQNISEKLGITQSFSVSGVNTAQGHFDVSDANKNQLAWSGVGQYTNMVNPMQMAILCGAIANGGTTKYPVYIEDSESAEDITLMSTSTADKMQDIMRYTVGNYYGDGMFSGLTVGAKTGTAEVGEGKEPNAWMVGYSTDEEYPLAFAVVVEDGGLGYYNAGPIAKLAMVECAKSLGFDGK